MRRPIEPTKEDCCNSGCNPCIFDVYNKQMILYNIFLENGENKIETDDNGISQLEYTKFVVVKNMKLCEHHNQIYFRKETSDNKRVWWKPGDHFLCKYSTNELTCTRAYTPLRSLLPQEIIDFSIIVKKYDNGLVSNYLYSVNEGEETVWRGPYGHYKIEPNKFNRIIMIAQGTGIAPFISIIENILNNEEDMTRITLLYCCKTVDSILFRNSFYNFKSYWNFTYTIFASAIQKNTTYKYQEPIKNNRLNYENLDELKPFLPNDQFLLCGSPEFMENYNVWLKKEVPITDNIILF